MASETYTDEQANEAQDAWERRHPDQVSKPEFDRDRTAWVSGYIACWNDLLERFRDIITDKATDLNDQGLAGEFKPSAYAPEPKTEKKQSEGQK